MLQLNAVFWCCPCIAIFINKSVGRFLPRNHSSLNVVYKMYLSDLINIIFLCILILEFLHYLPITP
jgi:hypothetical protein